MNNNALLGTAASKTCSAPPRRTFPPNSCIRCPCAALFKVSQRLPAQSRRRNNSRAIFPPRANMWGQRQSGAVIVAAPQSIRSHNWASSGAANDKKLPQGWLRRIRTSPGKGATVVASPQSAEPLWGSPTFFLAIFSEPGLWEHSSDSRGGGRRVLGEKLADKLQLLPCTADPRRIESK